MNRRLAAAIGLLSLILGACARRPEPPREPTSGRFRAGQVWSIKTPAEQPNAKLTVLRVERYDKVGTVVHVAISDVVFAGGQTRISHLPFAESAIAESVTTLERESAPIPDFAEGYRLWREAFDSGKGGVFTIPVADFLAGATRAAAEQVRKSP